MSDLNQLSIQQQLREQQAQSKVGGDADTLDSISQRAPDSFAQKMFKLFGFNPDIQGHGIVSDVQFSSFSLSGLTLFKDMGGMLSSLFKYFTRELPAGLTDGSEGGGATGGGGDMASTGGDSGSSALASADMHSFSGPGPLDMQPAVEYGGKLIQAGVDPHGVDVPVAQLSSLNASATPVESMPGRGESAGVA